MGHSWQSQVSLSDDWGLQKAQDWRLKLCWSPKKCYLSGKDLWGKRAYHGIRTITGPGDPVYEDYWIDRMEFLIWKLKGNHK
jgi:hypothetical protein